MLRIVTPLWQGAVGGIVVLIVLAVIKGSVYWDLGEPFDLGKCVEKLRPGALILFMLAAVAAISPGVGRGAALIILGAGAGWIIFGETAREVHDRVKLFRKIRSIQREFKEVFGTSRIGASKN